ncbi:hypothetical protein K443DRAFT_646536 [Laccaria amethystina LaAM-08-1]|uniref:SET domain-containing protein n=1 Tax=Laccaria amethystina LaAM-08-1 TaxID=1095629 RepID=A0A0C9WY62_9AGAR|nr:hypothetical protein K443DRAFT_646536 [Laccaria amethystina LaAM-08-1]
MSTELPALSLKNWLSKHGGGFNTRVRFSEATSGSRIVASEHIPEDTEIVSCPFDLAITRQHAQLALGNFLDTSEIICSTHWSERQWISTYIIFHWIISDESPPNLKILAHYPYLNTLPCSEKLLTPLHFTSEEMQLFKGTNLYGATLDRERDWRTEWADCLDKVTQANQDWGKSFTWSVTFSKERYLTAATYLSSRAFPSSLLSPTPSLKHSPLTEPVLLPGIDSLNHARGQPVSWVVRYPNNVSPDSSLQEPKISLILHTSATAGDELFNNYGPKPNSELILGYGFSLPQNPDDTILLKIGGIEGHKWEIGRNAIGAESLWKEILGSFIDDPASEPDYEDVLDASSMLLEMVQALLDRLPVEAIQNSAWIRPEVCTMFRNYVEGQRDILTSLVTFAKNQEHQAIQLAREAGVEIVFEDD